MSKASGGERVKGPHPPPGPWPFRSTLRKSARRAAGNPSENNSAVVELSPLGYAHFAVVGDDDQTWFECWFDTKGRVFDAEELVIDAE